jgi:hypothetical protein
VQEICRSAAPETVAFHNGRAARCHVPLAPPKAA